MKTTLQASLVVLRMFFLTFFASKAAEGQQPQLRDNLFTGRNLSAHPLLAKADTGSSSSGKSAVATEQPVIEPGPVGGPPSDALVLFDGHDLSPWKGEHGAAAKWKVDNGFMEVNGTGNIVTTKEFGDVQVHVEWASPSEVKGEGQGRGNSGVYLQGRYEVQVLDSYQNKTYFNGQAGALYGVAAPLVNACRKPGQWQAYDIIFHAPRRAADGNVESGSVTVLHNGILVLDHVVVEGKSTTAAAFQGVVAKGPLMLQDHGNPVRYRNVWIRRL